ncbi:uncharacterized protein LOC110460142, partial [Mizuhopecten yessoensis]|uniref:uncharacterized protein LOC110460142 n=1 Tax=Mizuhopecten yessoensis TaxID=6573 RepID=UPI000B45E1C7
MDCLKYFVVLLVTLFMHQTFGFDIALNKNAVPSDSLEIMLNLGTINTGLTLNKPDGSSAGNCLAPLGGVSGGCTTGFTQDFTNGVTTFSIASVSRATDEGTWASAHGTDTGSITIKVLTIPTLIVSQTVSALTLSSSNTQSLTITATCAYPAVSLDVYFVPTGGGTAVSSPSSTATCTSTGNAGCADTDAESYDCVIVPKLETTLSAGTYYVQFVVNLAGQYEPIGLNATITDTVITIEVSSSSSICDSCTTT